MTLAQSVRRSLPPPSAREQEREIRAVAHELKTPLAIVFGYATTLLQQDLPEESRRWFLQVIADQSRRLLRAIDRLEELTRLQGGVPTEPIDLGAASREAADRAIAAMPGARIQVEPADGREAVMVRGAQPWLDLALEEAMVACASAAGERGTLRVGRPVRDGDGVRLALETTPPSEPMGIGVYLARRIVDALGGALEEERGRLSFVLRP
jgi:K+-sensing histidine kinase KdpD